MRGERAIDLGKDNRDGDSGAPGLRALRGGLGAVAALSAVLALGCYISDQRDVNVLRSVAMDVTRDASSDSERALSLMSFVHDIRGTKRNESTFVLAGLRATARQVLASGGDCADKSRLLSAMLRSIGIDATMGMCFHPITRRPTHTFVEARPSEGDSMVLDPAYDMSFPRPGGGYFGLLELRNDPGILERRVAELRATNPPTHPVYCYDPDVAPYSVASTINWNRGESARWVADLLRFGLGERIHLLPRPIVLEAPKLAVAAFLAVLAALLMLVRALASGRWVERFYRALRRAVRPSAARGRELPAT